MKGLENPADSASRGLLPSELIHHELWWNGPQWLHSPPSEWPKQSASVRSEPSDEERKVSLHTTVRHKTPIIPYDYFSSFARLKRVTAWVLRFIHNCQNERRSGHLSVKEMESVEAYWLSLAQGDSFAAEIQNLKSQGTVNSTSTLGLLRSTSSRW